MLTLYTATGTCALASQIALEEAGAADHRFGEGHEEDGRAIAFFDLDPEQLGIGRQRHGWASRFM